MQNYLWQEGLEDTELKKDRSSQERKIEQMNRKDREWETDGPLNP